MGVAGMPKLPSWIIGYGLLLIACDAIDSFTSISLGLDGRELLCGWVGGAVMVAAGLASMQGRRSIRLSGVYIALFLPLTLAGLFAWDAAAEWRVIRATGGPAQTGVALSSLAIISILMVAIASRLRPREGIASRGYTVPLTTKRPTLPTPATIRPEARQSQVG
jgi:hypothetical protein